MYDRNGNWDRTAQGHSIPSLCRDLACAVLIVVTSVACSSEEPPVSAADATSRGGTVGGGSGALAGRGGTGGQAADVSVAGSGLASAGVQSGAIEPVYFKASNTDGGDLFGVASALSADGKLLVVGANREASTATGIDGDQSNNSATDAGAVYTFSRIDGTWQQEAYLKASNSGMGDGFGTVLAASADGTTLAIGAPFESSATVGVNGNENDDSAVDAGAV